jgi:hypothetical protein
MQHSGDDAPQLLLCCFIETEIFKRTQKVG